MNFSNSLKKIAAEFSGGMKIYKLTGGLKPTSAVASVDTSKYNVLQLKQQQNLLPFCKSPPENFFFNFSPSGVVIKKSIIEPNKAINIFELPVKNSINSPMGLPFYTEKEIDEPSGTVISKKAAHIIHIRRRKMRIHKRRKLYKKLKSEILKRKARHRVQVEKNFEINLKTKLSKGKNFDAEKYVTDILNDAHWKAPVTRLKGRLAPKWAIEKYLNDKEENKNLHERIKQILK